MFLLRQESKAKFVLWLRVMLGGPRAPFGGQPYLQAEEPARSRALGPLPWRPPGEELGCQARLRAVQSLTVPDLHTYTSSNPKSMLSGPETKQEAQADEPSPFLTLGFAVASAEDKCLPQRFLHGARTLSARVCTNLRAAAVANRMCATKHSTM